MDNYASDDLVFYCTDCSDDEFLSYENAFKVAQFGTFANFFKNKSKWFTQKYLNSGNSVINPNEKRNFVNKVTNFIRQNYSEELTKSIISGEDVSSKQNSETGSNEDQNLSAVSSNSSFSMVLDLNGESPSLTARENGTDATVIAATATILRVDKPEFNVSTNENNEEENVEVVALVTPKTLDFNVDRLNTLYSQMMRKQVIYLMNQNPKKNKKSVVGGNKFSLVAFDFEMSTWLCTPDDVIMKISKPLKNFPDTFDSFVQELSVRLFYIFPYQLPPDVALSVSSKFGGNLTQLNDMFVEYRSNPNNKKHTIPVDIVELVLTKLKNQFHIRYGKIKACGWWPPKLLLNSNKSRHDSNFAIGGSIADDNAEPEVMAADVGEEDILDLNPEKRLKQISAFKKELSEFYDQYELMADHFDKIVQHITAEKQIKAKQIADKKKAKETTKSTTSNKRKKN